MKSYPVNIIVGSRYDRYKSFNPRAGELKAERLSPRAAISVSPTDWLMMYGSISSAFRAPQWQKCTGMMYILPQG